MSSAGEPPERADASARAPEPPGWFAGRSQADGREPDQAGAAAPTKCDGHADLGGRESGTGGRPATAHPLDLPGGEAAAEPTEDQTAGRVHLRALTGGRSVLEPQEVNSGVTVGRHSTTDGAELPPPAFDFRVRCPDCGPQYVAIADVRFVSTGGADTDRYLFTCPACGTRVRRHAGPELAEILRTSGVATLALHRGPGQGL